MIQSYSGTIVFRRQSDTEQTLAKYELMFW